MYSLILKISHNKRIKDAIALARGIYRVSEVCFSSSSRPAVSSWILSKAPINVPHPHEQSTQPQAVERGDEKTDLKETKENKQYLKQFKIKEPRAESSVKPTISTIPSNRVSRIFEFSKLGLSLASATVFAKGKDTTHYQEVAEKVADQLCKMRGAPLKLAQMLSIQQDNLIPAPIRKAFEKARQSAHVIPRQQVELMLKKNLGEDWENKFQHFEWIPFASASIGQVHQATLLNGSEVAVKIQYHQVKQSIQSDIQNLGLLLKFPGVFPKGMYPEKLLKNTRLELMQECDYLRQKFYQEKYSYYLKQSLGKEANLYRVPKIFPELSTSEILVSEFVTGIKMKELEEEGYSQELRDEIGRRIMKLTFRQLFQMGIMQSDPNPSNYTYNHSTDQLNLYDFGATHVYKRQFLQNYYRIIQGAVQQDPQQIWQSSITTGFVTGEENMAMKKSHIQSIMITGQPLRQQKMYDFGLQEITSRIYQTIPLMLKNRVKPPPEEVYSLHRKLSGSYLACIRLRARVDCKKIFEEISFKTLAAEEKYEQMPGNNQK